MRLPPHMSCPISRQVVSLLQREGSESTRRQQILLGRPVCQHSFRQLLGVGATRFQKLKSAADSNEMPATDGRRRPRKDDGTNPESLRKRQLITEFLTELYNTLSEPMPEAYLANGKIGKDHPDYILPDMRFKRHRGKLPGKRWREREWEDCGTPLRLLPPGSFTEYASMCRARFPDEAISLKLFCSVLRPNFRLTEPQA